MGKFRLTNEEIWDLLIHGELITSYKNYRIDIKTDLSHKKIYHSTIYKIVDGFYLRKEADTIKEIVNFVNEMLKGDKNE